VSGRRKTRVAMGSVRVCDAALPIQNGRGRTVLKLLCNLPPHGPEQPHLDRGITRGGEPEDRLQRFTVTWSDA
jgi:hypothetical protein